MKCFNHAEVDAVATCRACGRALCHACVVDVQPGCSCHGACEQEVRDLNDMMLRGKTAYQKSSAVHRQTGALQMLMGAMFIGISFSIKKSPVDMWMMGFGILMAALGVSFLIFSRRLVRK